MVSNKEFLKYNQQMKLLRDKKGIYCKGSFDKSILCRAGYFNLVNGYKDPFVSGRDCEDNRIYISGTDIKELYSLKQFDFELRMLLFKYIVMIEEDVRTLAAHRFDECNLNSKYSWFDVAAYDPKSNAQDIVKTISKAYMDVSNSNQEYVKFYMDEHKVIPTWIMIKVIKFSTFIDFLKLSKPEVKNSICLLYGMIDEENKNKKYQHKILISSLHLMRVIRNICAHNERLYAYKRSDGRVLTPYFDMMSTGYMKVRDQKIIDLIVFMKYYLPNEEYMYLIEEIKSLLSKLKDKVNPVAFDRVRGSLGIKDLDHIEKLLLNPKNIEYNKF